MPFRFPVRQTASAVLAAILVAACAEPPPPPPPPPAPPSVALSPKLIELAGAYRYYMVRSTGITSDFADGDGVARSLKVGAAYEPGQLLRGAMAYGAVAALQDKTFVDGVRVYAKDAASRRQVAHEILRDPAYAVGLPGSASAAGLVIGAIGGEGQRLYDGGKSVKQSAYDIQRQPWSKAEVADRSARLQAAKTLSASAMAGDVAETARLQQASIGATPLAVTAATAAPPYTPTVVRSLAIAALAALGEAGDANVEQVLGLMQEPNVGTCMNMSKLNLYQCLAVARPHYEDVFCLGQHAMMDTGRCMIKAAGLPEPYEPRFVPSQDSINKGMPTKKAPARKPARKS
ncbi:hypothetical protein [Phenylobacterium kunshanense]|uniref:Uncharacterized protein n=1 Tax=Phenylobacterium kunshanense TaxID=1445034 RepID=A0A328BEE1_9CAUL|nr:hypothetical protein [Phenylobacterium kunshanense]RAK64224.1 hypothetical protein DJ019_13665 [Phenylobacterium kunshanense]